MNIQMLRPGGGRPPAYIVYSFIQEKNIYRGGGGRPPGVVGGWGGESDSGPNREIFNAATYLKMF